MRTIAEIDCTLFKYVVTNSNKLRYFWIWMHYAVLSKIDCTISKLRALFPELTGKRCIPNRQRAFNFDNAEDPFEIERTLSIKLWFVLSKKRALVRNGCPDSKAMKGWRNQSRQAEIKWKKCRFGVQKRCINWLPMKCSDCHYICLKNVKRTVTLKGRR